MKTIQVKVKPNAQISCLQPPDEGAIWLAQLKSLPVDGKGNRELLAFVAEHFGYSEAAVSTRGGASGPMKLVKVEAD